MQSLAAFIMRGTAYAAIISAGLLLLSLAFPLLSIVSTAAVILFSLRNGPLQGAYAIGFGLVLVAVASAFLFGNPAQLVGIALLLWGTSWLIALILRETAQLGLTLEAITVLTVAPILGVYGLVEHPAAIWYPEIRIFVDGFSGRLPTPLTTQQIEALSGMAAQYLPGTLASAFTLVLTLSLFLGRTWQARLYNPGGFRAEYMALRAHHAVGAAGLIVVGALSLANGKLAELARNAAMPLSIFFLFVGLAALDSLLVPRRHGKFWLVGIYISLFVVPHVFIPLAFFGLTDTWMDWRRRWAFIPNDSGE